jgi:hypothetical protein
MIAINKAYEIEKLLLINAREESMIKIALRKNN